MPVKLFPPLPTAALALLACPVCHGTLEPKGTEAIACTGCGRVYPVRDGIPVLIASESM